MLFDCGSIAHDPDVKMDDVLARLWQDATDPGASAPRIDVVVATHRHRDHVSGFEKKGWARVRVGEVWMPWTEHPTDREAKRIRETQSRLALALDASLTLRLAGAGDGGERLRMQRLQELAANALSNAGAMEMLHEGFAGSPLRRFLPEPGALSQVSSPALPGVTAYVLGPSRDKEVIRDMDPPAGQSFLRLVGSEAGQPSAPQPFASGWRIDRQTWKEATEGVTTVLPDTPVTRILALRTGYISRPDPPVLSDADREALGSLGDVNQAVAVSLDKAVNGTSLMILLKIGRAHLLFPGDAQWGSWQAALRNDDVRRLLEKVTFYKVGHHGSHNATPTEFVNEVMPPAMPAMISTRPVEKWPEIPRMPLLTALTARGCEYIRSDQMTESNARVFRHFEKLFADVHVTG
jgi:hypothetical protein